MCKSILIVEDHPAVRHSLRSWLSSVLPQHEFLEACSGEEALDRVAERLPSVVLMDIGLPGMSGIEATRRIRSLAPGVKIVVVSMHDSDAHRNDAEAAGASAYVAKGRMGYELLPALAKILETTSVQDGAGGDGSQS